MSLATRCTACGTIFRIVEDQLRVSDGWVRCGRCAEIFDARELLFDIERDAPPPWPTPFAAPAAVHAPPPEPPPPPPPPAPPPRDPEPREWAPPHDPAPEPRMGDELPTGWPTDDPRHEPRWVDEADSPVPAKTPPPAPASPPASAPPGSPAPAATPSANDLGNASTSAQMPEFMRRAERSARWDRPAVRLALGLASLALAGLLAAQVAMHFRDALAASHPSLRGPLQSLCQVTGCTLAPWRHIEALSIDSTSLNPVGSSGYRLQLSLRNKTTADVAAPSVELSLTDASGAPFARRVVAPELLSPAIRQVSAESEQALSFNFSTGGQRVSGYSVNIFYP